MSIKQNIYSLPTYTNNKNYLTQQSNLLNKSYNITTVNNNSNIIYNNNDENYKKNLPNEISVGAIIYNLYTHSVLLIQGKNKFYGFPKGHIENNETEIATMKREIKEETSIDLDTLKYIIIGDPITQNFYLKRKYIYYDDCALEVNRINIFYVIMINEKEAPELIKQEDEILKIGWYPIYCALTTMKKTNSNQTILLEKALININEYIAKKTFM